MIKKARNTVTELFGKVFRFVLSQKKYFFLIYLFICYRRK